MDALPHTGRAAALQVDGARLWRRLDALGAIGAVEGGGLHRLAYTEADRAARDWAEARMRALGMAIHVDAVGNLLGVRAGRERGPLVLMGSHLDTVAGGGRFDGALGVVAALEAAEVLTAAGVTTRRPLGVVVFANEEGVRFGSGLMGSRVLAGTLPLAEARALTDADGRAAGACIDALGLGGTDDLRPLAVHSYLELHVEQGPVLEAAGAVIGVVTGVPGLSWTEIRLRGEAGHAGGTPLHLRRDAAHAAAGVVRAVRRLAVAMGEPLRATAGALTLVPNQPNVIPGEARLTVDLRHPDDARLREAEARLEDAARQAAAEEGVAVSFHRRTRVSPVTFDDALVDRIEHAAGALGLPAMRLLSGGGHDAQAMAARCPSAMIFVPSRRGLSHHPDEYTAPEQVAAGASVLLRVLHRLAEE